MNKKLYFMMIFYIVGTFIIVSLATIVMLNFFKDAKVFERPVVTAKVVDPAFKVPEIKEEDDSSDTKTFKYTPAPDARLDLTDYGEEGPPPPKKTVSTPGGVKVEIVNYSGLNNLSEDVKTTLEAAGFKVSVVNFKADKNQKTTVIERNDKKAGILVQNVIKSGKIIKAVDSKSKFDVTLKLGEDYRP